MLLLKLCFWVSHLGVETVNQESVWDDVKANKLPWKVNTGFKS